MLNLTLGTISFDGNKDLTQFRVKDRIILVGDANYTEVIAKFMFKRIFYNHLATTYIPSLCILLIAECTVFFKKEHFKTSIPVTVTTMLGN